jgi:hypothetical protein
MAANCAGGEPGSAPFGPWLQVNTLADGMKIFRRSAPGEIPQVRAVLETRVSVAALVGALTDFEHLMSFVPNLIDNDILRIEARGAVLRQRLGFPLLLAPREFDVRVTTRQDKDTGDWLVTWDQLPLDEPPVDAVEPRLLSAVWRLARIDNGARATYTVRMDPGGVVPQWLVRLGMDQYLPEVVRAIVQRAGGAPPVVGEDFDGA